MVRVYFCVRDRDPSEVSLRQCSNPSIVPPGNQKSWSFVFVSPVQCDYEFYPVTETPTAEERETCIPTTVSFRDRRVAPSRAEGVETRSLHYRPEVTELQTLVAGTVLLRFIDFGCGRLSRR